MNFEYFVMKEGNLCCMKISRRLEQEGLRYSYDRERQVLIFDVPNLSFISLSALSPEYTQTNASFHGLPTFLHLTGVKVENKKAG